MRSPRTLTGRLALSGMVAAAVAVLLLTAAFALLLERRLDAEAQNVLRSRADAATATVSVRSDGSLEVADSDQDTALDTGIWIYEGRSAVERPPGSSALQATADSLAGTSNRLLRKEEGPATEYLSQAVLDPANHRQVGTVVAAISLDPYQRSSRVTILGAMALGAVLVAVVYLVARAVAARALRPVAEMTRQAGEWSAGDTSLRFGSGCRPGELEELAGNLDGLLDRLSAVLRREQQLSAEISHELRTPLAGITAEAELFASRPRSGQEARAAMVSIADGARRMERILETLLAAARAESAPELGRSDARAVVTAAVKGLDASIPVTVDGPDGVAVGVGAPVLERVLGPLLENAVRFAASAVQVRVSSLPEQVVIEVLDDGPGVPPGAEEAVFEPGRRISSDDGHQGAGLGLPLARRLARAAGGDLTCTAGPGGRFLVSLPRA